MSVCWSRLKRGWLASYREDWACCEFEYNEAIFKVVCANLRLCVLDCVTHHLYLHTYSNLTPSPTQRRARATLIIPSVSRRARLSHSYLWMSTSCFVFFVCFLLLCFYLAVSVVFSCLSHPLVSFFCSLSTLYRSLHPFEHVLCTFLIFPQPLSVSVVCHVVLTPRGLCLSFVTGGVEPLCHFPPELQVMWGHPSLHYGSSTEFSRSPLSLQLAALLQ